MKICFVVHENNRGTILDRIAHEIGKAFDEPIYHYDTKGMMLNLPKADHYFVTHYSMLPKVLDEVNPDIYPVTVFFTHNKGNIQNYIEQLNLCHSVIAESPEGQDLLIALGVRPELVHFVPESGDNEAFKPHQRTDDGAVLVCGTNYADGRKNPELIGKVINLLQNRKFILVGNNWDNLSIEKSLATICTYDYIAYPEVFNKCSIYLSCSKLEGGGPNSLIEAMHANLIPVVSDTGNARQYIQHGYNGFIFPVDAKAEHVAELIEEAYRFRPQDNLPFNDVWRTVTQYTWPNYALQMKEIITGDYSKTLSQGDYKNKPE